MFDNFFECYNFKIVWVGRGMGWGKRIFLLYVNIIFLFYYFFKIVIEEVLV